MGPVRSLFTMPVSRLGSACPGGDADARRTHGRTRHIESSGVEGGTSHARESLSRRNPVGRDPARYVRLRPGTRVRDSGIPQALRVWRPGRPARSEWRGCAAAAEPGHAHVSGQHRNASTQRFINQGLNLAYAFNHAEARRAFREAARLSPNLAMAYWGQALVLGPNINALMEPNDEPHALELVKKAQSLKGTRYPARAGPDRRARTALLRHGQIAARPTIARTPTRCARCSSVFRTTPTSRCSTSNR